MAVNLTVRDIINFPGGTAKTVTVDVIQVVPKGGTPEEGDEKWVTSTTTTATASGGGSIQSIFKNDMRRGWIDSSGLKGSVFDIVASTNDTIKVAIDEDISQGVDVTLTAGMAILGEDVAQDLENKIQAEAVIGSGGGKIGNLSYLNAQVRFINGKFRIESGTVTNAFTGADKSSVAVADGDSNSVLGTLGFDISLSSEDLAVRTIAETSVDSAYSTGDLLEVVSTANISAGDSVKVSNTSGQTQTVLISGTATGELYFVTESGTGTNLAIAAPVGTLVRKLQEVDTSVPVSAVNTVDKLYRFAIDSIVNQIDFSA